MANLKSCTVQIDLDTDDVRIEGDGRSWLEERLDANKQKDAIIGDIDLDEMSHKELSAAIDKLKALVNDDSEQQTYSWKCTCPIGCCFEYSSKRPMKCAQGRDDFNFKKDIPSSGFPV